jgi:hypothetical protein
MQVTAYCVIVGLLAVALGSCASQATPLSEMGDKAASDAAKCQSSGAALGSRAYKECRVLLEDKMSIENDVTPNRAYVTKQRPVAQ